MIIRRIAPFVPYAAIFSGLYILKNAWVALLLYHVLMLLVLYSEKELSQVSRLLKGGNLFHGLLISLFGLGAGILFYVLWPILGLQETLSKGLTLLGLSGISFYIWSLYFFLVNPFFEEAFWRGYIGSDNKKPELNDFLFAGYHALVLVFFIPPLWTFIAFLALISASWLWRMAVKRHGGLLLPVISHLAADISIMVVCAMHL